LARDVREALMMTAEEDRARIRDALADLRSATASVAQDLHAAMVEQTDAARASAAAESSTVTRSVRAVQSSLDEVSQWLQAALEEQAQRSRTVANAMATRMEAAIEGHLKALRTSTTDIGALAGEVAQLRRAVEALTGDDTSAS
jgi:small-conductance mechanosensitive channel